MQNGKDKVIEYRKLERDTGILYSSPEHLIGKQGVVVEVNDDRYDSSYPTGCEVIQLAVKFEHGVENLVARYCRKV